MSNQYNNAGRSLIIDEVIELKGTEGNTVSNFRQQLDAQLIRRDTQAVMAQVNLIASDSYVSV